MTQEPVARHDSTGAPTMRRSSGVHPHLANLSKRSPVQSSVLAIRGTGCTVADGAPSARRCRWTSTCTPATSLQIRHANLVRG
jgi:hypothetical protein